MQKINKFFDFLEEFLLFAIIAVMIVMNFLNVLFRYLLPQSPFSYTEEVTLLLFVWVTMIGIACGIKRGSHTGMSLITDRIPPLYHKVVILISTVLMCLFSGIIVYSGIILVKNNAAFGNILPALKISANWKSMAFPVGGILMIYRSLCAGGHKLGHHAHAQKCPHPFANLLPTCCGNISCQHTSTAFSIWE